MNEIKRVRTPTFSATILMIVLVGLLMVGCASYYKVTDTNTGKDYHTKKIKKKSGGAIEIKDAKTGAIVTIQASEVRKISKQTYEEETGSSK